MPFLWKLTSVFQIKGIFTVLPNIIHRGLIIALIKSYCDLNFDNRRDYKLGGSNCLLKNNMETKVDVIQINNLPPLLSSTLIHNYISQPMST